MERKINETIDRHVLQNALESVETGKTGCIYYHEYEEGMSSFSVLYIPEWLHLADYLNGEDYYMKENFEIFYNLENLPDEYLDICIDYENNPINMKIVTLWENDGMCDFELTIDYEACCDNEIIDIIYDDFEKFKKEGR